jgi:hypothetical protein
MLTLLDYSGVYFLVVTRDPSITVCNSGKVEIPDTQNYKQVSLAELAFFDVLL